MPMVFSMSVLRTSLQESPTRPSSPMRRVDFLSLRLTACSRRQMYCFEDEANRSKLNPRTVLKIIGSPCVTRCRRRSSSKDQFAAGDKDNIEKAVQDTLTGSTRTIFLRRTLYKTIRCAIRPLTAVDENGNASLGCN